MRIGLMLNVGNPGSADDIVAQARAIEAEGFASMWMAQVFGAEALTMLAIAGREVPRIELGTGVVPVYRQHPFALAQQALTTQAITDGRLALGIGLSHQVVVEGMWGMSYDRPARYMKEYLAVLLPLLTERQVSYRGEQFTTSGQISLTDVAAPPVLLAALAPRMLQLAGAVAEGTVTWMVARKTLESHIAPSISAAAEKAGRGDPRIVVALPVCVTPDVDQARESAARFFATYGFLPSYRAMLDREGADGPADVAIVGDEDTVRSEIEVLFASGATEFVAAVFGSDEEMKRTTALLASMV